MPKSNTSIYDIAVRDKELIQDFDNGKNIAVGRIVLVPCRNEMESAVAFKELEHRARKNGYASCERQARELVSFQEKIPQVPYYNLIFPGTKWKSRDGIWIPFMKMVFSEDLQSEQWILDLMSVQETFYLGHNHDHFVQVI